MPSTEVVSRALREQIFRDVNRKAFRRSTALRRVDRFVRKHYAEEITLHKAAQTAAVERTYFSNYFREKVHINFSDWLRRVRITKALALLKIEDCSVTELAHAVGFSDVRTFQRAFKRYTHMTPRDFQQLSSP